MNEPDVAVENFNQYQRALKQHRVVIVLFKSQQCQLCLGLGPCFNRIADKYSDRVKSLIFDTENILKVRGVDVTPTLVVYIDGNEVEKLEGVGRPGDEQKAVLEEVFDEYSHTVETSMSNSEQHPEASTGLRFTH